jgi:acyl dehydratase
MTDFPTKELKSLPSLGPQMLKALFSRKKGLVRDGELPALSNRIASVQLDPRRLERMRALCHISDSDALPPTALHILAAPLHIALLTDKRFPISSLGIVHASNQIRCLGPVPSGESVEMGCRIGPTRWRPKGLEFDLLTQASLNGETVWEEVTTIFSRVSDEVAKKASKERIASPPDPEWPDAETTIWELPANLGRAYGSIAGDRNPIHLYSWTAKPFGFSRAIIHGMYLLTRAMGELGLAGQQTENQITFKRPVPLPGAVRFQHRQTDSGREFRLLRQKADKVLLQGTLS